MKKFQLVVIILIGTALIFGRIVYNKFYPTVNVQSLKYDLPEVMKKDIDEKKYFSEKQREKVSQIFTGSTKPTKSNLAGMGMQDTLNELRSDIEKIRNQKPSDVNQVSVELESVKYKIDNYKKVMLQLDQNEVDYSSAFGFFDEVKTGIDELITKSNKNIEINYDKLENLLELLPSSEIKMGQIVPPMQLSLAEPKKTSSYDINFVSKAYASDLPASCQTSYTATEATENPDLAGYLDINDSLVKPNAEILELSRKLLTPQAMFEYVRKNIEYHPSFGFTQNAQAVHMSKIANAYDQSSLLISLLRSSGIPARFVTGEVWISGNTLKRIWNEDNVWDYYYAVQNQRYKENISTRTDRIYRWIGNDIYYLVPHAWVETYTSIGLNERKKWVQLDPSFVLHEKNDRQELTKTLLEISNSAGIKIFSLDMFFFEPDPMTGKAFKKETPDIYMARRINAILDYSRSNNFKWENNLTNFFRQDSIELSQKGEFPFGSIGEEQCIFEKRSTPDNKYFPKIKFNFNNVNFSTSVIDIAHKDVTIRYRGNSATDRLNLDLISRGTFSGNPNSIKVIPQLYINDLLVKEGSAPLIFGRDKSEVLVEYLDTNGMWKPTLEPWGPNAGGVFAYHHSIVPPSQAIFDNQIQLFTNEIDKLDISTLDYQSKSRLQATLLATGITRMKLKYAIHHKNLGNLLNGKVLEPAVNYYMSSGFRPITFNDRNYGFSPDLPLLSIDGVSMALGDAQTYQMLYESAYVFGSQHEHQIMENHFNVPGSSTVSVIQEAKDQGIPVIKATYNQNNYNFIINQLVGYSPWYLDYLRSKMRTTQGEAFIPKSPVYIGGFKNHVIFGPFGARIGRELGGGGGYASLDTQSGFSSVDAYNTLLSFGNDLASAIANSPGQVASLIAGYINGGCATSVGQPVNLNNGGMWHKFDDILPMGSGSQARISFSRTYLSQSSNEIGVLGYGWTHNLNPYLKTVNGSALNISQVQDIIFKDGDGNEKLITFNANQPVILPYHNVSYKKESNEYVLTDRDFNEMFFYGQGSFVGKIRRIRDRNGNSLDFTYNETTKLLATVVDGDGRNLNFTYQDNRLVKVADFTGRQVSFSYDSQLDLIESSDLLGRKTAYAYYNGLTPNELNHNLKSFKNEKNEGVEYYYYKNDKVFRHIEPEGKITTFQYDTINKETTVLNSNNEKTLYRYDIFGNVVTIENPDGTVKDFKYDLHKNRIYEKNENGFVTNYKSDARGNITEIQPQAPLGKTVIQYHSKYNIPVSVTDPKGNVTSYEADSSTGNILSIKRRPSSGKVLTTSIGYNTSGEIISITDPKQNVLSIERVKNADKSQLITYTNAEGSSSSQTLDPLGRLIERSDLNGITSTYSYNVLGLLESMSVPSADISQIFNYDKSNNLIKVTKNIDGKSLESNYKFDGLGNVIEATNERGETYKVNYTQAGCGCSSTSTPKTVTGPKGEVTKFEHDWRGNITHKIDPMGIKTKLDHDPVGNLSGVTVFNPDESINSQLRFSYGAMNLLKERTEVVGYATVLNRNIFKSSDPVKDMIVKTVFNYDSAANLTEKVVSRPATGEVARINYTYNGLNQISTITSNGYKHNISKTLSYDDNSNLTEIIQNNTRLSFLYNNSNRISEARTFADSSGNVKQPASTLKYSYSPGGQITKITDGAGVEIVGYELDHLFRPSLARSGKFSINLEFDSLGRKRRVDYPNKIETIIGFDQLDRIKEIQSGNLGFREFDYDELSNIGQIKTENGRFDYSYDFNSSLIGSFYKGSEAIADEKFVWDASGNRMNGSRDPSSSVGHPRPILINNALFEDAEPFGENSVGRFSFIYDMHGSVVKKYDNHENVYYVFEYDADNKLVFAEKYKNDSLVSRSRYTFDGLGRRVEKEVTKGSIITRKSYIYNGENILLEYNTSGSTPLESARYIGTGGIDDNLMVIRNGKGFFYHKDHLGSITAITDEAGQVVQKNHYSAFGKVVSIRNKDRVSLSLESALDQPFYFTGREWDNEIDMYYYRARHYDPQVGRFIQMDPIGLAGGDTNLYRYVENNPINFFDPYGLEIDGPIYTMANFQSILQTPAGQQAAQAGFMNSNFRYVYTDQGVMDMRHVQAAFQQTNNFMSQGVPYPVAATGTYGLGLGLEFTQALGMGTPSYGQPGSSAFSPEDIPSNAFGIQGASGYSNFNNYINSVPEARVCRPY